jgi:hypothetical protein
MPISKLLQLHQDELLKIDSFVESLTGEQCTALALLLQDTRDAAGCLAKLYGSLMDVVDQLVPPELEAYAAA